MPLSCLLMGEVKLVVFAIHMSVTYMTIFYR